MFHSIIAFLQPFLAFLKAAKENLVSIGFFVAIPATVLFFARRQVFPSWRLLRHGLKADAVTPWWRVLKELWRCATRILSTHTLYKAVRLRVESEILSPRPVRPYHPVRFRRLILGDRHDREVREWKERLAARFADLAYRSSHESPTIRLENAFDLYRAEGDIRNYLRLVFHDSAAPVNEAERGRFLCRVTIQDGYLAPLHLVRGLLSHFEKDWKPILDDYRNALRDGQEPLHRFLANNWLLWGPSIPLCSCGEWSGGIAFQFGYGDENNSVPVFVNSRQREAVLKRLRKDQRESGDVTRESGLVPGSRISLTAVPIWSESLGGPEIAPAQASLRNPGKEGLLLEYVDHEESGAAGSADSDSYYSAYLWVMLEVTACRRWPDRQSLPQHPWDRLIPVYEHANLFDPSAFAFMKQQLAEKTLRFVRHAREADPGFKCRVAFAIDATGCGSPPLFPFPEPSLEKVLAESLWRKENADLRECLDLGRPPHPRAPALSSCRVPEWVDSLEKRLSPPDPFPSADTGFSFHEFTGGPDKKKLRDLYLRLYVKEFPDADERESLENILAYLRQKHDGGYGMNNYHVLAIFEGGNPVAISISDYLEEAEAGVIEFLAIAPDWRGRGLGRQMLAWTEKALAADAARADRKLRLILAEMDDPFRMESRRSGMDPVDRARIWAKWGFGVLRFPYVQPSLGDGKQPVTHLLLLAKRFEEEEARAIPDAGDAAPPGSVAAAALDAALKGYMRWAMRIPRPEEDPHYREMREQLGRLDPVPLIPLHRYLEKAGSPARASSGSPT